MTELHRAKSAAQKTFEEKAREAQDAHCRTEQEQQRAAVLGLRFVRFRFRFQFQPVATRPSPGVPLLSFPYDLHDAERPAGE